jgi:hypothetical protein
MFQRTILPSIIARCFMNKAIIMYGARQVGKTTLTKAIVNHFPDKKFLYCTGDDTNTHDMIQPNLSLLSKLVQ